MDERTDSLRVGEDARQISRPFRVQYVERVQLRVYG
jgi:hypothetical protein